MSASGIREARTDMKELRHMAPQIDLRVTGTGFPAPNMRGPGMQGISPNIWGPGSHIQDLFSMQGLNPEVKYPGPDMRNSEIEMSGQMLVPAVTNSQMGGPDLQNERRPGPEIRDTRGPLSAMYHPSQGNQDGRPGVMEMGRNQSFGGPQIEGMAPDIGRGQKDRGESPHTGGMRPAIRGGGVRDPSGHSFRGSERIQRQSRHDGSLVLAERGFQAYGGRERSLDSDSTTGSEGRHLIADRLSPAMTDERWGLQKGRDVPIRGPGPNINYESGGSNISSFGQDSTGSREHFKEPRPGIRAEKSVIASEMRESEAILELRRPDMTQISYMGPGPIMDSMGGSDTRGDDMPNITNPDWRGPGPGVVRPDMRGQTSLDWSDPRTDIRDDWEGPDRRGSGPFIQEEWRVHQPDMRGPYIESHEPDGRGAGDLDFREPESEMSGPHMEDLRHDRRRPRGPDFMATGGPEFVGPRLERRGPALEGPGPDRRRPGDPDFRGPGPERRCSSIEAPGPVRRGPAGSDFRGPRPEMRGPAMEGPVPERRGPGGPDFRGSRPANRGLSIEGLGPERRCLSMESPGPNRRGPGEPDFGGPGPERRGSAMAGPGPDRRGPGGPDFKGQGPESRGLSMEGPGPDRRSHDGPDFRGPGPERRNPAMDGPGPDRRGPGVPDFRGPGPPSRGLSMEGPGPDRRGHDGPRI
ncbi:collagen alpha-1(I) chain-like [Cottoperca gobio]|uniref:Collagen alpha-1(I) chain-like n=1 Tax=Cottoperca gobio TaxID=56716 RepID=A0A6J2Q0U7_COTGO|nr:collagen alpha-1(I) chain-like [Cottoperca gobio]